MDYQQWIERVNRDMLLLCGMGIDDLPDYDYSGAFKRGRSTMATAKAAVKATREY